MRLGLGTASRDADGGETVARRQLPTRALAVVTIVWATTGVFWSLLFPPYQAPDEPLHIDMVMQVADDASYPRDPFAVSQDASAALTWINLYSGADGYTTDVPHRGHRPSLDSLPDGEVPVPNPMYQHPPAYYGLAAIGYRVTEPFLGHHEFDQQFNLLRLGATLLALPIPWFIALTVLRLGGSGPIAIAASLLPLAVPQFTARLGAVNNGILLVTVSAVAAWAVARLLTDAGDRRAAIWLGGALALALLTKGFGLPMLVMLAACLLVAAPVRIRASLLAWSAGIALVGGGWWWAWNQVRFGALQPRGQGIGAVATAADHDADPWEWIRHFTPWIVYRSWGWFGAFARHVRIPPGVVAVASATSLALVGLGVRSRGSAVRRFALVTALLVLALLAVVMYGSYSGYARNGMLKGIQGRYLFAALPALCVLAALGLQRIAGRAWAIGAACALVVVMQAVAAITMLDGMWGAADASLADSLRAAAAWWPWSPAVPVIASLAGAAGLVWLAFRGATWAGGATPDQVAPADDDPLPAASV